MAALTKKGRAPSTPRAPISSGPPAEQALVEDLRRRLPSVDEAAGRLHFKTALASLSELGPSVDRFFTDVLVMTDDDRLRTARLSLMAHLRDVVLRIGDVSEVVAAEK